MDMKKILENMDSAANGERPAAGAENVNDMKTILESIQSVEECGPVDEGPMPTMAPPAMPEDKGNPVSVNVSINASGKDHVEDLLSLMRNAGLDTAKKLDIDDMPPLPMKKMDMDDLKPGMQDEPCPKCGKVHIGMSSCNDSIENDDEAVAEYDNEPDEQYQDMDYMLQDLSGGEMKKKKMYKASQRGDNAMAAESIKARLLKALEEKKAKPDFLDMDKDGNKKEPMKKAIKDKEKGAVKEMDCPKCGKPGKKKLMACSSCGCS